jgi:hypothetical protein
MCCIIKINTCVTLYREVTSLDSIIACNNDSLTSVSLLSKKKNILLKRV